MTVLITLTTAGTDTGPFNLYSNVDGYSAAFETGVSKAALVAGYLSSAVPNGTLTVRVMSAGLCTNYVDLSVITTTTTTTSTSTSTTSTTTTLCPCVEGYTIEVTVAGDVSYALCDGTPQTVSVGPGPEVVGSGQCVQRDSVVPAAINGAVFTIDAPGACCSNVTTTTTTTTVEPILCDELYNNTGSDITGVGYTDCNGTILTNQTVGSGQSICAQQGSVSGGGFLTNLGNCNPA